jgi:chorismate mutase/prephenate dehydratase
VLRPTTAETARLRILRRAFDEGMTSTDKALTDLRQQIDEIDTQLHDLVMARAALADEIRQRKGRSGSAIIQPGREIAVLRRLAGRHHGPFPFGAVARIWREIISALTHLQQPLAIAVYAPEDLPGAWDLARDHFGSTVPMTAHGSVNQVIRAVTDRSATVGILPMPREQEEDPWWRHLPSVDAASPRIFARLPLNGRGNARGAGDALAIASHIGDFSMVDRTLIALEMSEPISRTKLASGLNRVGLAAGMLALHVGDGVSWTLAEITSAVPTDDRRLDELRAALGTPINAVYHLGGYADPIVPAPHA